MSISLFKKVKDVKPEQTLVGTGNAFSINLYQNEYYNMNAGFWRLPTIKEIKGISTDNITFSLNTTWDETGGAKLGKKIAEYTKGKLFKLAAGYSPAGYKPFIVTDEWTQQKLTDTDYLSCDLKFKLYYNETVAGSSYVDTIKFLTHICSPSRPVKFGEDGKDLIHNAAAGAAQGFNTIMGAAKQIMSTETSGVVQGIATVVNTADKIYNTITSKSIAGVNNGNFTVLFTLGDKIFASDSWSVNTISDDGTDKEVKGYVDWIINSFNFTPSTQFIWDDKKELPMPLWCDFTIQLQTRVKLSNKLLYNIFNSAPIEITNTTKRI